MKNELNPFDRRIKDKLENLSVPYEESHWDQLEQQLEQNPNPAAGDALILSRMADWEVPFEADTWNRMEELLDHEDAVAADFDRLAAERLHRMEAPYESGNWDLMAQKIDEAFSFRHWLHRNHVPELVLMILLVFTLVQYLQWGHLPDRFVNPRAPQENSEPSAPVKVTPAPPAVASVLDRKEDGVPETVIPAASSIPPVPPIASAVIRSETSLSGTHSMLLLSAPSYFPNGMTWPSLEPLAKGSALAGIDAFKQFVKRPVRLYVGAFSGADFNFIHAPMDEVFKTQGYWTDSVGYHAGLFFSMERKKWAFQTGLTYSAVAYQPNVPVQQYGSFDYLVVESFDRIQYQFMQIPLQIRRGFLPKSSKWDVYALGGVEANLILDADYDIQKTEIFSSRSSGAVEDVSEKSKLNKKQFPEGVLNGDSFFHNVYLSFSAGFGVERSLSNRYQLFAEPIYAVPFAGNDIGPNEDRIHRFSLRLGVKYRIK
ncbi:MAG: hypothetical protein H6563_11940 [Lewinellaceae bacterium]|nr:hypothetical protein [Lewinellaceae bacterium]